MLYHYVRGISRRYMCDVFLPHPVYIIVCISKPNKVSQGPNFCMDNCKTLRSDTGYVRLSLEVNRVHQSHQKSLKSKICHFELNEAISSQMECNTDFAKKYKNVFLTSQIIWWTWSNLTTEVNRLHWR